METLDLNNKRKREKLTASEWNSLIDAINLLILRYNDEATIPTKLSQLINDAGFITDISGKADKSDLARVATTGSYNDLKDKPDLSNIGSAGKSAYELAVENGYQGTVQLWLLSLKGQDGTNGSDGQDGITPTVSVTTITGGHNVAFSYGTGDSRNANFDVMDGSSASQVLSNWNESDTTSAAYIANKPTIPTIPTNVSSFINDAGYLTSHLSLSGYVQTSNTSGLLKNDGTVDTNSYAKVWSGTQAQYTALSPDYDSNTIYIIT